MAKVSKTEVEAVLKPYFFRLVSCITDAWQQYKSEPNLHIKSKLNRAITVHDYTIANLTKEFDKKKDSFVTSKNNLKLLVLITSLGTIAFRFKKLKGVRKIASNIKTHQTSLFTEQQELENFLPSIINLTVGYIPDRIGNLIDCFITCTENSANNFWHIDLNGYANQIPNITPLYPQQPPAPTQRVFLKGQSKPKNKGDAHGKS